MKQKNMQKQNDKEAKRKKRKQWRKATDNTGISRRCLDFKTYKAVIRWHSGLSCFFGAHFCCTSNSLFLWITVSAVMASGTTTHTVVYQNTFYAHFTSAALSVQQFKYASNNIKSNIRHVVLGLCHHVWPHTHQPR